jgi:hypothetical protein
MGRLLLALIAFAVMGYLGYMTLYQRTPGSSPNAPAQLPQERLQHVKETARKIEVDTDHRVDNYEHAADQH